MSQIGRIALKAFFETGDIPTEAQFIDLIDSVLNIIDNASFSFEGQAHGGNSIESFSAAKTFNAVNGNNQEMIVTASTTIGITNELPGTYIFTLEINSGASPVITIGASFGNAANGNADISDVNGDINVITLVVRPNGSKIYTTTTVTP